MCAIDKHQLYLEFQNLAQFLHLCLSFFCGIAENPTNYGDNTHSICHQQLFWKSTNLKIDTRTNSSHYFDMYYKNTEIIKASKNTLYRKVQKVQVVG